MFTLHKININCTVLGPFSTSDVTHHWRQPREANIHDCVTSYKKTDWLFLILKYIIHTTSYREFLAFFFFYKQIKFYCMRKKSKYTLLVKIIGSHNFWLKCIIRTFIHPSNHPQTTIILIFFKQTKFKKFLSLILKSQGLSPLL